MFVVPAIPFRSIGPFKKLGWLLLVGMAPATAQDFAACASLVDDAQRLRCYDTRVGSGASASPRPPDHPASSNAASPAKPLPAPVERRGAAPASAASASTALSRRWGLDPAAPVAPFTFQPHRQNYLLPVAYTSAVNTTPYQPTLDALAGAGLIPKTTLPLDATEARFQLSLKVKLWDDVLPGGADLWFGYTQQSAWQVYNRDISSPFRSTDYAPEAMLTWRTDADLLGLRWRLLTLGLVHQSNGQGKPLSRSWNRVYADFGFERGDFTLSVRPWRRLSETAEKDDNPDIARYLGHGDMVATYTAGQHQFGALLRHDFKSGRGATQLDWSFPLLGPLRGYVQVFSGYGYSLLDYNHRQTTGGVGFILTDRL